MVFTQASQLRITQRPGDTGWVALLAVLQRATTAEGTAWVDANSDTLMSVLSTGGGSAYYQGLFVRKANWQAVPHRVFLGAVAPVSQVQRAGTISHIKADDIVYDYQAVITPAGYIQPMNIDQQDWQVHNTGDLVQITASWTVT
jgi:hypothetical protein